MPGHAHVTIVDVAKITCFTHARVVGRPHAGAYTCTCTVKMRRSTATAQDESSFTIHAQISHFRAQKTYNSSQIVIMSALIKFLYPSHG